MPTRYKKGKGRPKLIKQLNAKTPCYCQKMQHNVEKASVKPKIEPEKIFEMMGGKKDRSRVKKK